MGGGWREGLAGWAALPAVTSHGAEGRQAAGSEPPRLLRVPAPSGLGDAASLAATVVVMLDAPGSPLPAACSVPPTPAMQLGVALQALLLAMLLAGSRAATGRLLSGECPGGARAGSRPARPLC